MSPYKNAKLSGTLKYKRKGTKLFPCGFCKRPLAISPAYTKRGTKIFYCDKKCEIKNRFDTRDPDSLTLQEALDFVGKRGAVRTNSHGYRVVVMGKKRMLHHRLVMEKIVGKKLHKDETVHHVNGIRDDNRPENLIVLPRKNHPSQSSIMIKKLQNKIQLLEKIINKNNYVDSTK